MHEAMQLNHTPHAVLVRKPTLEEVNEVKVLLDEATRDVQVLPRTLDELQEHIRDLFVCVDETGVIGCCALHIDTANLAEIRSLVVRHDARGRGIGGLLVEACMTEAETLRLPRVYALTRAVRFFENLGFYQVSMDILPQKVFRDCMRCSRRHACDEIAVIKDVPLPPEAPTGFDNAI